MLKLYLDFIQFVTACSMPGINELAVAIVKPMVPLTSSELTNIVYHCIFYLNVNVHSGLLPYLFVPVTCYIYSCYIIFCS